MLGAPIFSNTIPVLRRITNVLHRAWDDQEGE